MVFLISHAVSITLIYMIRRVCVHSTKRFPRCVSLTLYAASVSIVCRNSTQMQRQLHRELVHSSSFKTVINAPPWETQGRWTDCRRSVLCTRLKCEMRGKMERKFPFSFEFVFLLLQSSGSQWGERPQTVHNLCADCCLTGFLVRSTDK